MGFHLGEAQEGAETPGASFLLFVRWRGNLLSQVTLIVPSENEKREVFVNQEACFSYNVGMLAMAVKCKAQVGGWGVEVGAG